MKKEFYLNKQIELTKTVKDLNKKHANYGWLKLVLFILLVVSFSISFYDQQTMALLAGVGLIIVFILFQNQQTKLEWQLSFSKAMLGNVEDFIKRFDIEIEDFIDDGSNLNFEENYLINDLDLVNKKSLFQYLCLSKSKTGQTKLLDALVSNEPNYKNEAVYELSQNKEQHLQLSSLIRMYDSSKSEFSLNDDNYLSNQRHLIYRIITIILPLAFISLLIGYALGFLALKYLVALIIINTIVSLVSFKFNQNYLSEINNTNNNLAIIIRVLKVFETMKVKNKNLVAMQEKILFPTKASDVFKQLTRLKERINSQSNILMYLLAQVSVVWDYQNVLAYDKWKKATNVNANEYLDIFYELELLLSLGVVELTKETTSQVTYLETSKPTIIVENLYHPLLVETKAIKNSFTTNEASIIITGSNMSGKTTFIRSIAINYLLAYAGASVCASKMEITPLRLFTSIRVSDNLDEGISTFYAEIKRIKAMIEYNKLNKPMLCLVDEIFKGTNLNDRIIGASKVIDTLSNDHTISMITTHDPQLCALKKVTNYRFEESYQDDLIKFDYLIKEGPATTSNAQYLLRMAGIIE